MAARSGHPAPRSGRAMIVMAHVMWAIQGTVLCLKVGASHHRQSWIPAFAGMTKLEMNRAGSAAQIVMAHFNGGHPGSRRQYARLWMARAGRAMTEGPEARKRDWLRVGFSLSRE